MKKTLIFVCAALVAIMVLGCKNNGNVATPTPNVTIKPSPSAVVSPSTAPSAEVTTPGGTAGGAAGTTPGGVIEGFKEGDTVDVAKLPSQVTKGVEKEYPGATITAATYATYMDSQMYLVTLSGAPSNIDKAYVKADGTVVPYTAQTSPAA